MAMPHHRLHLPLVCPPWGRWAISLTFALALAACGGGGGSSADSSATPSSTPGTGTLGTNGGTVQSSDQQLQVQTASGALLGDTTFTVSQIDQLGGVPDGYQVVAGSTYQVNWQGAGFASAAGVTLRIKTTTPATAQDVRMTAQGLRFISDTQPSSAVVRCADGSTHVYAIVPGDSDGYGNAQVILCDPTTSAGTHQSTSQVAVVQPIPPSITTPPADVSVTVGDTATFRVVAKGSTLSYQWLRNGTAITGATSDSYSLAATAADNGAHFAVVVSNALAHTTSASALLTVGPPPPPAKPNWTTPTVTAPFTTGLNGAPAVGALAIVPVAAWEDNGVLGSDFPGVQALQLPIRSTPQLLTGPNTTLGYIVYIADDGQSGCGAGTGNRLSALAIGWDYDHGTYAPSAPLTVYQSTSDCVEQFAAGFTQDANGRPVVAFALVEHTARLLKVGTAGASHAYSAGVDIWTPLTPTVSTMAMNATGCDVFPTLYADSLYGLRQARANSTNPPSVLATLVWLSGSGSFNLCAAQLQGGTWTSAKVVMPVDFQAEPVVTMDGVGNTLAVAMTRTGAQGSAYSLGTAYLPAQGTVWLSNTLDVNGHPPTLPTAAFNFGGDAFVAWRTYDASGAGAVHMARRAAAGTWDPIDTVSDTNAVETRYPRLCVGAAEAMVLFQQNYSAGSIFHVYSRLWRKGAWSDTASVQDNGNEGRYADCPRATYLSDEGQTLPIYWRETDPNNASSFRIMSSTTR